MYIYWLVTCTQGSIYYILYGGGLDIVCKMMGAGQVGEAASYCIAEGMDAGKEMQELGKI